MREIHQILDPEKLGSVNGSPSVVVDLISNITVLSFQTSVKD
jgi:hypothetical protein